MALGTSGFSRIELIIALSLVLLIGGAAIWAAVDTGRRSRDVARLSDVRTIQSALESHRILNVSYPSTLDEIEFDARTPVEYAAEPQGCGPSAEIICSGYQIRFVLEGAVGTLPGGLCTAVRTGMTCSP